MNQTDKYFVIVNPASGNGKVAKKWDSIRVELQTHLDFEFQLTEYPYHGEKIAIAAVDGLFERGQTIYLEDKVLGIIHDLRQNPYSFTGTSGILNDRFVLRYTNETLGNEDFENNSDVLIFSSDLINIQSFNQTIQSVTIHNV